MDYQYDALAAGATMYTYSQISNRTSSVKEVQADISKKNSPNNLLFLTKSSTSYHVSHHKLLHSFELYVNYNWCYRLP